MVVVPPNCGCIESKKSKLVNAIFHVLLLHDGPTILAFDLSVDEFGMVSECDLMISSLSRGNNVREFNFASLDKCYHLPISFFSMQGLESIKLVNCTFQTPLTFNGLGSLRSVWLTNVEFSAKTLQWFLAKCPLLEVVYLWHSVKSAEFVGGNGFTFVELLQHVPLIKTLGISRYYIKHLAAGTMTHKNLPTSLLHLKSLHLHVSFTEQDEVSSALCIIRSSPVLELISIMATHVRRTRTNFFDLEKHFFDPEKHSDLYPEQLNILVITSYRNSLPHVMAFVKLIMAKSPALKKVRVELSRTVSVDEELELLRDLVRLPFPKASPSAELIIKRL